MSDNHIDPDIAGGVFILDAPEVGPHELAADGSEDPVRE